MTVKWHKTGNACLTLSGKDLPFSLQDFWRWSVSDLVSNATRGRLAEFIVATALNVDLSKPRDEWQAYDLLTPEGIKVEVKSSSFVQSWHQKKPYPVSFSIAATKHWDPETGISAKEKKRQADVYVFCLLKHLDKATINPMNLDQWEFFVVSTKTLNSFWKNQKTVSLNSLKRHSTAVSYAEIHVAVLSASRLR